MRNLNNFISISFQFQLALLPYKILTHKRECLQQREQILQKSLLITVRRADSYKTHRECYQSWHRVVFNPKLPSLLLCQQLSAAYACCVVSAAFRRLGHENCSTHTSQNSSKTLWKFLSEQIVQLESIVLSSIK